MAIEKRHILIVDDNPEDRTYLKRLLTRTASWTFAETNNAEEALAATTRQRFDCIVMDQRLPDATGLAVLARLRNGAGEIEVPVVLLTSVGDEALAAAAIQAGALDYVPKKGLTADRISFAVQNAIEKFELIERRRKSEDDLRQSRQRLHTMAEAVPGILFTHGPDGVCNYLSNRFYEYTGLPAGSGEGPCWNLPFHPEDPQRTPAAWLDHLGRGEPYETEYRLRRHDGVYRWFTARGVPIRENGAITEWAGVATDVHDMKEARRELEERRRNLERSNEELQRFAYVISHDLQSPLRTVESMTQLFVRRYGETLDSDTREVVGFVESGVQRMSRLITSLLEYSRLSHLAAPDFAPLESSDLVDWALTNLRAQIAESAAAISVAEGLPRVVADHQLARVFQNLIGNAIKYRGTNRPEIRISAERDRDHWVFTVRDKGIGLDMKHSERIFDVFQRLHSEKEYEGTGIGLAICKRIVERYGGRIWVESAPGAGSAFHFSVPAVPC